MFTAALRIHLSESTHRALEELGGYDMVGRGPVSVKVCIKGRSSWSGGWRVRLWTDRSAV